MQAMLALLALCPALATASAQLPVDTTANRPVTKVITLLKDMFTQLSKEQEQDAEVYSEMMCWCKTNDKEKTLAITSAEQKIAQLKMTIETKTQASAELNTEIDSLKEHRAASQAALDTATVLRNKALAEFNEEEKDLLSSIASVSGAYNSLSKHHVPSLLQESGHDRDETLNIVKIMQEQMRRHSNLLKEVISPHQWRLVASLMQAPDDYLAAVGVHLSPAMLRKLPQKLLQQGGPNTVPEYNVQSGQIFGILKQMKETFETNLASSQSEDALDKKNFQDLEKAKKDQIAAAYAQIETKLQQLADSDFTKAHASQDLGDTEQVLAADTDFLANLKVKCATADADYAERAKTRNEETTAVSEALGILSGDDAKDLFERTLNGPGASLLQQRSEQHSDRREAVAKLLRAVAQKFHHPQLMALAVKMRLDAFGKAKKGILELISNLQKEKEEEIVKKELCVDNLNENAKQTQATETEKENFLSKMDTLMANIKAVATDIEDLKEATAEAKVQARRAGEDREKENRDFQMVVADQRSSKKVLIAAKGILVGFYHSKASLLKFQAKKQPAQMKYEKSESGASVIAAIDAIIAETKGLEAAAIRSEQNAQTAYETFVKDTNNLLDQMAHDINEKTLVKAKLEIDHAVTTKEKNGAVADLLDLANEATSFHLDCDYTIKNFELRQTARDEEAEALKQAVAILSGASFKAMIQDDVITPDMVANDRAHLVAARWKREFGNDDGSLLQKAKK